MDVVLIIMIVVVGLLLLYVNLYLLALYCHPEDGGFGASLLSKIVVVAPIFVILWRSLDWHSVGLKSCSCQLTYPTLVLKVVSIWILLGSSSTTLSSELRRWSYPSATSITSPMKINHLYCFMMHLDLSSVHDTLSRICHTTVCGNHHRPHVHVFKLSVNASAYENIELRIAFFERWNVSQCFYNKDYQMNII